MIVPENKQFVLYSPHWGRGSQGVGGGIILFVVLETVFMDTNTAEQKISSALGNPEKKEGPVARTIEEQTSKLPSDLFLWAAGASMLTSLTLKLMNKKHTALFVGQWAAPFLLLGIYNKIVKVAGHDSES